MLPRSAPFPTIVGGDKVSYSHAAQTDLTLAVREDDLELLILIYILGAGTTHLHTKSTLLCFDLFYFMHEYFACTLYMPGVCGGQKTPDLLEL